MPIYTVQKHWDFFCRNQEKLAYKLVIVTGKFENSGLDESFFDQMADTIQLNGVDLRQLKVKSTSNESLDFHFLSKLRHLEAV